MRRRRRSNCPVHFALEAIGDPWALLIVRDLVFKGRTTYSDFLRGEERISTNILANRLARLERDGITRRDPASGRYTLTEKGVALIPVLLDLMVWGAAFDKETAAAPGFIRRILTDRDALIAELTASTNRPPPSGLET